MLLLSLEGPPSDFEVFSVHVVVGSLEGFYTVTLQHFHPKKTQRGSEKLLKSGNTLLQSWPAGFRCRTFMMCMHNGHVLNVLQNVIQRMVISSNACFVEVFCFPPRAGMFPSHRLKTTIKWVILLDVRWLVKCRWCLFWARCSVTVLVRSTYFVCFLI